MSRIPRVVVPGVPHHVTQRGTDRQNVFFSDRDREVYLRLLRRNAESYGLLIEGYCLMGNHVHLLVMPCDPNSMSRALGKTHGSYASYANAQLGRSGHFWQNRFFSCAIEEAAVGVALRYIERNPVRAGLASRAVDWSWSSAKAHAMGTEDTLLGQDPRRFGWTQQEWQMMLESPTLDEADARLRRSTHTGRPFGSCEFTRAMERTLGRPLAPRKGGRPSKAKSDGHQVAIAAG